MAKRSSPVSANGHGPGKLYDFTFQDTGVKVHYRKVSPLLLGEAVRLLPKPPPPLVAVKYGDETRQEPNEADPDYQKALEDWNLKRLRASQKLTIERGVVVELDEAAKAQVAELREWWRAEYDGAELYGSDKMVYIMYIAIGSGDDLQDLMNAISRRSHPTEAAISETLDSFPSGLPGQ